jgi:hypothetical protein
MEQLETRYEMANLFYDSSFRNRSILRALYNKLSRRSKKNRYFTNYTSYIYDPVFSQVAPCADPCVRFSLRHLTSVILFVTASVDG